MHSVLNFCKNLSRLSSFSVVRNRLDMKRNNVPVFYSTHDHQTAYEGMNSNVDVNELTKGDSELEKKLKLLVLETDVLRQEGHNVPDTLFLKHQHWQELLNKPSRSQRIKYLKFLFKLEKKKENRQFKKEKAREERENRPEYVDDGHIRYGLNHNTFLLRIYETTMNNLYNSNLMNAMKFGQKLVVDCSYDSKMTARECANTAKQLMLMFAANRMSKDPFDLHLCNARPDSHTMKALHSYIATMYEPWFPLGIHDCSYLDLFPKHQLLYLTPHCRQELLEYDHDTVYIIGGIVDKVNNEPLSLAKAKKEGLRMAKLPLDRYLQWGSGSGKSLTLNCMLNILSDIKDTGDWKQALRHVPKRKICNDSPTVVSRFAERHNRHSLSWDREESEWRKTSKKSSSISTKRKMNNS